MKRFLNQDSRGQGFEGASEKLKGCTDLEQFSPTKLAMKYIIILIALLLTIFTAHADAHRLQPAYLEINEQSAGKFSILWKRPFAGGRPMSIAPPRTRRKW